MRFLNLVIASATALACSPPAPMDEVQRNPRVVEVYLGRSGERAA